MRPKKVSVGDLRDQVQVYSISTDSRSPTGGIISSLTLDRTVFVNIQGKLKSREDREGSIQYFKEYDIIARVGSFNEGDQLWFGTDKISVISIDNANAGMVLAKGISV